MKKEWLLSFIFVFFLQNILLVSAAPIVTINPMSGQPGTSFKIFPGDFTPAFKGQIQWDGKTILSFDSIAKEYSFTVPSGASSGTHVVRICVNCGGGEFEESAQATFTVIEPDTDKDGIPDSKDNCPSIANQDQLDTDKDGVGNFCDNCPSLLNQDQKDSDKDGIGDVCDSEDTDKDGIIDEKDNCPKTYNPDQKDSDKDGIGDVCDSEDTDKDGIVDEKDNCPKTYNPDQKDIDKDGIGDICDKCDDRDVDGDGIRNCDDACPTEAEVFNDYQDSDGCPDIPEIKNFEIVIGAGGIQKFTSEGYKEAGSSPDLTEIDKPSGFKEITAPADLKEYVVDLIERDNAIDRVSIGNEFVSIEYRHPAKLLGLFNVDYKSVTRIDDEGNLEIKTPWWLILTSEDSGKLKEGLNRIVPLTVETNQKSSANLFVKKKRLIETISDVSRNINDKLPVSLPRSVQFIRSSQIEMDDLAAKLALKGIKEYRYGVYRFEDSENGNYTIRNELKGGFRGLLSTRDPALLIPIDFVFYDDGLGNLVYYYFDFNDRGELVTPLSITFQSDRSIFMAIDTDQDGAVNKAFGYLDEERLWFLSDSDLQDWMDCFSSPRDVPLGKGGIIGGKGAGRSGGSGGTEGEASGVFSVAMSCLGDIGIGGGTGRFQEIVDGFRDPDCKDKPGDGIASAGWTPHDYIRNRENINRLEREAIAAGGISNRAAAIGEEEFARAAGRLSETSQNLANQLRKQESWQLDPGTNEEWNSIIDSTRRAWREYNDAKSDFDNIIRAELGAPIIINVRPSPGYPIIGETGTELSNKDPRCYGREVRVAQGTSCLLDSDYRTAMGAGPLDFIGCLKNEADTVRSITGGKCWTEVGPDDKETVKCETKEEESPGGTGPGGIDSCPTDRPGCNTGPRTDSGISYIDSTPLGGFLITLCGEGAPLCKEEQFLKE